MAAEVAGDRTELDGAVPMYEGVDEGCGACAAGGASGRTADRAGEGSGRGCP
ncbi:MAG TPA: hypothetical protein VLD13_04875 [Gaiellaceae bacterium]|nr:hypothetical protein [Gaiellaceae bacterium]